MVGLSFGHILIVTVVVLIFGSRRIPQLAADIGRSLKAFKTGMEELPARGLADAQLPEQKKKEIA